MLTGQEEVSTPVSGAGTCGGPQSPGAGPEKASGRMSYYSPLKISSNGLSQHSLEGSSQQLNVHMTGEGQD